MMRAWAAISCAAMLALVGCGSSSQDSDDPAGHAPTPKLSDLRSRLAPEPEFEPGLVIVRLDVRRNISLASMLAATQKPPAASDAAVEAWRENGLHVGVLTGEQAAAALELMPPVANAQQSLRIGGDTWLAIDPDAKDFGRHALHLRTRTGSRDMTLAGGRYQFLTRLQVDQQHPERVAVELVPQYHLPRMTVQVRTASEQLRDGHVFDDLTLAFTLRDDQMLIVAITEPPATSLYGIDDELPVADSIGGDTADADADADADGATVMEDAADGESDEREVTGGDGEAAVSIDDGVASSLGSRMLWGRHLRQPVQRVLLIAPRTRE